MLRHKSLIFFILFVSLNLFATEVFVAKKDIPFNSKVTVDEVQLTNKYIQLKKYCKPIDIKSLKEHIYITNRYIRQGTVICKDDINIYKKNSVLFNFGSIQIEQNGKIIFENDEYIKIKKDNGQIEKIYKDGRTE